MAGRFPNLPAIQFSDCEFADNLDPISIAYREKWRDLPYRTACRPVYTFANRHKLSQSAIRNPLSLTHLLYFIRLLRSRPGDRSRLGGFKSLLRFEIARNAGGKSEHHRTAGWLTARRGDPTE